MVPGGHGDPGSQVHHAGHLEIITGDAQYIQGPRGVDPEVPGALTGASGEWITISVGMTIFRPFKKEHLYIVMFLITVMRKKYR